MSYDVEPGTKIADPYAGLPRQQRRYMARQAMKDAFRKPPSQRRGTTLPDPVVYMEAQLLAAEMLRTGPTSQAPKFQAVRKMARYLMASPLHKFTRRHTRGGWRPWPRSIGVKQLNDARQQEKDNG
jgi:hypothetical protein